MLFYPIILYSDIIGRVKNGEALPCRPVLFSDVTNVDEQTRQLMVKCWNENSFQRPSFVEIKAYIRKNLLKGE